MSNFPLYDNLLNKTSSSDLTVKQKEEFTKMIKNIDQNGYELIYILIRIFQIENNEDKSTFKLPYGGKYVKNDIKFNLEDLPNQLKQILYKFLNIHIKSINEKNAQTVI